MSYTFYMEKYRLHLTRENTLVVRGWYRDDNPDGHTLSFAIDGTPLAFETEIRDGVRIRQKYLQYQAGISQEIVCFVTLPKDWEQKHKVVIYDCFDDKSHALTSLSVSALKKDREHLFYYLERRWVSDETVHIVGWVMGRSAVEISVQTPSGEEIPAKLSRIYRRDVMEEYDEVPGEIEAGFQVDFPAGASERFRILFKSEDQDAIFRSTVSKERNYKSELSAPKKFITYIKREGWESTFRRIKRKIFKPKRKADYEPFRVKHLPSKAELERQRKENFDPAPLFSIVIPMYRTKEPYLKELLDSILAQTYSNWELCLADGSGADHALKDLVEKLSGGDPRVRYMLLSDNLGIADNTNAAIEMATGDYVILSDHDDVIPPEALYECAKAFRDHPECDVLYTDEDKLDMDGKTYFEPNFKPDFNIDYLRSVNYICHMFVVKRDLLAKTGLLRKEFDGAQDYDFILRCCEAAKEIYHIPKVLYHWRCHMDSTAANPESKLYAFEAGRRALEAHYERVGLPATVENSSFYGLYHTTYHWEEKPLISILVPNKDHIDDLKKCMDALDARSTYRNFEWIIIENNSTEESTFAYYKEIEQRENVQVVYYKGGFNYARINNFGVPYAHGDYLLLLNNDTEVIGGECLQEMLDLCMRPDVGIVGAKLCYEDDTIQHAGVVIGFGGIAGHTFIGCSRYDAGYMNRIICVQDYSAVTAACMMVKKDVYQEAGGLTEEFEVAFNDIDFCLKVRTLGKLVVYNPFAEMHHYESKSRGYEDTPEKVQRFNGEIAKFQDRWPLILKQGDPYYNPNLSLDRSDFSLKEY